MAYPTREPERVQFWSTRIDYTIRKLKPLFGACEVLADQFYNEATTSREASAGSGSDLEDHIRRTKSNIIYGYIDQSLSNMLDTNPVFQSFPENQTAAEQIDSDDSNSLTRAQGQAKIMNYRYRETNQLRVDERVALSAFLFPYGVAKIGYTADREKMMQELLQPEVSGELVFEDPSEENLFLQIGQSTKVEAEQDHRHHIDIHMFLLQGGLLGMADAAIEAVSLIVNDHIALHKKFMDRKNPSANTNVQNESPFAVHWPSDMFLTDLMSMEGPQDARWCAFGWELPVEEVQGDINYENTAKLKPSRWRDAPEREEGADYDGFDVVRGWEVWAKNFPVGRGKFRDIVLTVAEGHPKFLRYEEEWPYQYIEDYPCETLSFTPGLRRWFTKPTMLLGGGDTVQSLVNEVLDAHLSIIRKQKNVWLVDPASGITTEIMKKIMDAPDGSVIPVPGLMEAKGSAVVPLPFHQIPPEKGELLNVLQAMFDRSLGTPQPQRMEQSDTATEADIIERRNTSREGRKSNLLSEFQVRKARKMWQLDAQYRPTRLFLLDRNANTFLELTAEMAKGEYMTTMDITSHTTAKTVERSQWMDLLNLFAGLTPIFVEFWKVPPNLPELARRLLARGFDEHMVDEILPMLREAAGALEGAGAIQFDEEGNPIVQDPAALEAVQEGRNRTERIGPALPDQFSEETPSPGRQTGDAVTG